MQWFRAVLVGLSLAAAYESAAAAQSKVHVITDDVQYCVGAGVALQCVDAADVKRLIAERAGGQRSLADTALEELAKAHDELAQARLERAQCETTLGPVEARARRSDAEARWRDVKRLIEANHPGFEYDPSTRKLSPKPAAERR